MIRPRTPRELLARLAITLILLGLHGNAGAQGDTAVEISSPRDGEIVSGVIEIVGNAISDSFLSASLALAYADHQSDVWFPIAEVSQPVTQGRLAIWDTALITDGEYLLRLRMNGTDGTIRDATLRIQVRNYTSSPTSTPLPTSTDLPVPHLATPAIIVSSATAAQPLLQTPTPLPLNPAGITRADIMSGFLRGGLAALAILALFGAVILRRHAQ